jgi:hypothetical protein
MPYRPTKKSKLYGLLQPQKDNQTISEYIFFTLILSFLPIKTETRLHIAIEED